jgi:hypothetical protein
MRTYIHAHMHTCIHAYMHACTYLSSSYKSLVLVRQCNLLLGRAQPCAECFCIFDHLIREPFGAVAKAIGDFVTAYRMCVYVYVCVCVCVCILRKCLNTVELLLYVLVMCVAFSDTLIRSCREVRRRFCTRLCNVCIGLMCVYIYT